MYMCACGSIVCCLFWFLSPFSFVREPYCRRDTAPTRHYTNKYTCIIHITISIVHAAWVTRIVFFIFITVRCQFRSSHSSARVYECGSAFLFSCIYFFSLFFWLVWLCILFLHFILNIYSTIYMPYLFCAMLVFYTLAYTLQQIMPIMYRPKGTHSTLIASLCSALQFRSNSVGRVTRKLLSLSLSLSLSVRACAWIVWCWLGVQSVFVSSVRTTQIGEIFILYVFYYDYVYFFFVVVVFFAFISFFFISLLFTIALGLDILSTLCVYVFFYSSWPWLYATYVCRLVREQASWQMMKLLWCVSARFSEWDS